MILSCFSNKSLESNNMHYLLYQPAILTDRDCVFFNGNLIEESEQRTEIYDRILEITMPVSSAPYPWIGKCANNIVLHGCFNAVDEKGRTLGFIFTTDNEDFTDELALCCTNIGYSLTDNTISAINTYINSLAFKKKCIKYSIIIVSILVLLIIILLLCR